MQTKATVFAATPSLISKLLAIFARSDWSGKPGRPGPAARRRDCPRPERPDCGGYNEAFVIQYWAGYNPRH